MEQLVLDGARILFSVGGAGWVVAVILGCALFLRDRQYGECLKAQIDLAGKMAVSLDRASQSHAAVAASLDSRTGVFERLNERVGSLTQETEALGSKVEANGRTIEDIRKAVEEMRREQGRGRA